LLGWNCEHLSRLITTGKAISTQRGCARTDRKSIFHSDRVQRLRLAERTVCENAKIVWDWLRF
jgi:hypothetical protein